MTVSTITMSVRSDPQSLKKIRALISRVADKQNLDKDQSGCIILAVDEVCSNIIRHGYQNDTSKQIEVAVSLSENKIKIQICDTGTAFDLSCAAPRDPEDIKPGGLGVYIIREIMDKVEYATDRSGINTTTLIKNL